MNEEGFKFYPVLSRAANDDKWDGEKGRVTNQIEKTIPGKASIDVYLFGPPGMIDSCMEHLTAKGIPNERIFFDKFE